MYHYHMRVPSWGESRKIDRAICDRLDNFNVINDRYLMFDSGDDAEIRFILVSKSELTENTLISLKTVFEAEILAEEIGIENADSKTARKIDAAISRAKFITTKDS